MDNKKVRLCLIGPMPPPFGGMSVQTEKLGTLLRKEGIQVETIPTNIPLPESLIILDRLIYVRSIVRLIIYISALLRVLRSVDVVHILSNSYLSFFLCTAPAIVVAKFYKRKIIVNYRGGLANEFFEKYGFIVFQFINKVDAIIVPSIFLNEIFIKYNYHPHIVPNIVDIDQFSQKEACISNDKSINLLVVRNLEKIYNIACAVRAYRSLTEEYPDAALFIAGGGSEEYALKQMVSELRLSNVTFAGQIENRFLPELYSKATIILNPSNVDNFPISVLEAFAAGVPIVSTRVGGVPYLIQDNVTGLLVDKDDHSAMSRCITRLLKDKDLYKRLSENGKIEAQKYSWKNVWPILRSIYKIVLETP